jgi:hypothetical protein
MSIQMLADLLDGIGAESGEQEILDVLWLAGHLNAPADDQQTPVVAQEAVAVPSARPEHAREQRPQQSPAARVLADTAALHQAPHGEIPAGSGGQAMTVRAPGVPALADQLRLARALRPLKRRVGSRYRKIIDEEATAHRIAEDDLWVPAMRPAPTRWGELAVVVDGYQSMSIWRPHVIELRGVLERVGAFRDVRFWLLAHSAGDPSRIGLRRWQSDSPLRSGRELTDPSGQRVILVVSDCLGSSWRIGAVQKLLAQWAKRQPVAVLQPLPQRLWDYTNVRPAAVRLRAGRPAVANDQLTWIRNNPAPDANRRDVPVPVMELDADWLASWSSLVGAPTSAGVDSMVMFTDPASDIGDDDGQARAQAREHLSATTRVRRFRATASPEAYQLAVYLAAAPISLPVVGLVQRVMMKNPHPSQVAEVFLGGLLTPQDGEETGDPDRVQYDFYPGVRERLLSSLHRRDAMSVLLKVSDFVDAKFGQARDFRALLAGAEVTGDQPIGPDSMPFAVVAERVLRMLGGQYLPLAEGLAAAQNSMGRDAAAASVSATGTDAGAPAPSLESPRIRPGEITLPPRRSKERPLVCPYCYRPFAENEIRFRCSGRSGIDRPGCRPERDAVLAEITGQSSLLPPVFSSRGRGEEATCPTCGMPSRAQVCPGCHSRLPASFQAVQGRLIALVGPSYSGKTMFMTVLIHELSGAAGKALGASTTGADDTSRERFGTEYERPLYRQSRLLNQTKTPQQLNIQPLVFRFIMDRTGSRISQRSRELLLSFADGAGADLISPLKTELVARYLAAADGVLVLLDPLQFPRVRDLVDTRIPLPPIAKPDERPAAALDRITQLLLAGTQGPAIDKPVAIVFSKLDAIRSLLPADNVLHAASPVVPSFDRQDSAAVQAQVRNMLFQWEAGRIDDIAETYYRNYRYFSVSALGIPPTADNHVSLAGIKPYRVTDPFIWLLHEFSLIPAR